MPNDAKLGLIVGVGLVVTVAAVFFRKDPLAAQPAADGAPPNAVKVASPPVMPPPRGQIRSVPAQKTGRTAQAREEQRHVVQEGDTLFGLAQRYYGDGDKFIELYRANRDVLSAPEPLAPGTVLRIPAAGE